VRVKRIVNSFVVMAILLLALRLPAQPAQAQDVPDTLVPPPAPTQPIPYSHKTHLALGLQCQQCHTNPAPGNLMTFPATSACMQCHAKTASDKPAIQQLAGYDKSKTPVPWVRVYKVLPGVEWSHRKHLDAGMKCEMCHGAVAQMDMMAQVKSVTSMGGCIDCHKAHNAAITCVTCHAAWAPGMVVVKK
jgi:hypothetical protein